MLSIIHLMAFEKNEIGIYMFFPFGFAVIHMFEHVNGSTIRIRFWGFVLGC